MEEETGAMLHIKDVDGEGHVFMRGTVEAREAARKLVDKVVRFVLLSASLEIYLGPWAKM